MKRDSVLNEIQIQNDALIKTTYALRNYVPYIMHTVEPGSERSRYSDVIWIINGFFTKNFSTRLRFVVQARHV